MMEIFEKHGVKGTVALNAEVCEHYPRIIQAGNELGWEWMGHGLTNSVLHNEQNADEERALIANIVGMIKGSTGSQPKGWLGPALTESHNTPDILADVREVLTRVLQRDQSLFDLDAKYADVVTLEDSLQYLSNVGHNQ